VCLSVCHHSYGHNSHSTLMKLCTIVWNPKSKIEFVGSQNLTIPSPIFPQFFTPVMHCQWQYLSTTVSNHVDNCGIWWLKGCFSTAAILAIYWQGCGANKSWGHQFPPSLYPSLPSTCPFFYHLSPPIPPSLPLHSLPLPLEVGPLIVAKRSWECFSSPSGSRQSPVAKRYFVIFK